MVVRGVACIRGCDFSHLFETTPNETKETKEDGFGCREG